jgi:hypothetical protein
VVRAAHRRCPRRPRGVRRPLRAHQLARVPEVLVRSERCPGECIARRTMEAAWFGCRLRTTPRGAQLRHPSGPGSAGGAE